MSVYLQTVVILINMENMYTIFAMSVYSFDYTGQYKEKKVTCIQQ